MSFRSQNQAFIIDHMREKRFYNTTNLQGVDLFTEQSKAISLEDRVYSLFKSYPRHGFIWSDVVDSLGLGIEQHGSVKRSITNLMTEGKLYKSTNTKLSIFGKKAHYYFYSH